MHRKQWLFVFLLFTVGCGPTKQTADLVVHNGAIYTMKSAAPKAESMAIIGGRIAAIGSNEEIARRYSAKADIDLKGQMVLPGFHDAHVHPVYGGVELSQCVLNEQTSVEGIIATISACNKATPGTGWLFGSGWNLSLFPQANPNKSLLDAISTERPIFLGGADGHSSWANSTALTAAGIERETPNPKNGIIERDAKGEASGVLRETAQDIVRAVIPPMSAAERVEGLKRALLLANQFGITSLVEAAANNETLEAYRASTRKVH